MNRILLIAVGVIAFIGLMITSQPLKAQVYDEYGVTTVLNQMPYVELGSGDVKSVIPANSFIFPPSETGTSRSRDDGFYNVALPFVFEYNGENYSSIWVNINGYVMFLPVGQLLPSSTIPKNGGIYFPNYFFKFSSSYPNNIVAPYMGDHYYRTGDDNAIPWPTANQYVNSEISTGKTDLDGDGNFDVFTVQWKNLNINYDEPADNTPTAGITSSVGNFQLKLYKSTDQFSNQGDIQFCYGQVNANNPFSLDTRVITRNAVIGIKGNSGIEGQIADFLNGLYNAKAWDQDSFESYNKDNSKKDTSTTTLWQPSGGTDYRIHFSALGRNQKEDFWGDGDVNLSQLEGQKHPNMKAPRFVTISDARAILRAIVTRKPLPRERRREGYHGDVNHNGRYFFYRDMTWLGWNAAGTAKNVYPKDTTFRINIKWKNYYYGDSIGYFIHPVFTPGPGGIIDGTWNNVVIPTQISNPVAQIYYEANEFDAAMIMHYIGGRITKLPYLIDTIPQYGKVIPNELFADNIKFGDPVSIGDNSYKLPVYLNGKLNGPLALKVRFNGTVVNANGYENTTVDYQDDIIVIIGTDEFSSESPVCMVTIKTDENVLKVSDISFNDKDLPTANLRLSAVEESNSELMIQNTPNPFTNTTVITVNLVKSGNYTLTIFDAMGNAVKTFSNVTTGDYTWDGRDDSGKLVSTGVYLYRLSSDNTSVSKSMILTR